MDKPALTDVMREFDNVLMGVMDAAQHDDGLYLIYEFVHDIQLPRIAGRPELTTVSGVVFDYCKHEVAHAVRAFRSKLN